MWRLDLLARRFRSLAAVDRVQFEGAAAAAKRTNAENRVLALVRRRARPIEKTTEQEQCMEGSPVVVEQVVPGMLDRASAWLRLEVPKHTPCLQPTSPEHPVGRSITSLPQVWIWIEAISAVRHVLLLHSHDDGEDTSAEHALGRGTFGQCLRVTDSCTREVFCLKAPASAPTDAVAVRAPRKEAQVMQRFSHPNVVRAVALVSSEDYWLSATYGLG